MRNLRRRKNEIIALLYDDVGDSDVILRPRASRGAIPLTPLQQHAWAQTGKYATWARTHAFITLIQGELRTNVLATAFRRAVGRHDVLRTKLRLVDGVPLQFVDKSRSWELPIVDVVPGSTDVHGIVADLLDTRIEIDGPLFEACLYRLRADEHVLAVCLDQMITDCRSDDLLSGQIWNEYVRVLRGGPADDDRDAGDSQRLQFADYALWLADLLPSWQSLHAAHWQARFADGGRAVLRQSYRTRRDRAQLWTSREVHLAQDATSQLIAFGRDHEVYPAIIMLTAFIVAACHFWRCEDLTVATVDKGRYRPELQSMLGPLVNHLHLRIEVRAERSFAELLHLVTSQLQEAYQHRDFNWLRALVPDLKSQLYFNWVTDGSCDALPSEAHMAGVDISLQPSEVRRSGLPPAAVGVTLRHSVSISGQLTYEAESMTADEASNFVRLFCAISLAGVRRPESRIDAMLTGLAHIAC
jgi:hypothetical protein